MRRRLGLHGTVVARVAPPLDAARWRQFGAPPHEHAEGLNSRIQAIKRRACGYRNRERFRHAIYFHLGGLDLYPERLSSAHTIS